MVGLCAQERPFTSKSLHKISRIMRKRKKWVPPKPQWYKVDPTDERKLILKNGTRIKQSIPGVGLYTSEGGLVYGLTSRGLCLKSICTTPKKNYCKLMRSGCHQGRRYPYVHYKGKKYDVHLLVTLAWQRARGKGEEIDHINGDILDNRSKNLRVITEELNDWCGGVLKRVRNAAKRLKLPYMNPAKREPEDILEVYERFKKLGMKKGLAAEIERQKVIHALMKAAQDLHDPSFDPRRMTKERREEILSSYRVVDNIQN